MERAEVLHRVQQPLALRLLLVGELDRLEL